MRLPYHTSPAHTSTSTSGYTVRDFTPKQGAAESQVLVQLRLSPAASADGSFSLAVEGQNVPCRKSQTAYDGHYQYLNLQAPIPNLECSMGSMSTRLLLRVDNVDGTIMENIPLGDFLYINNNYGQQMDVLYGPVRKRRLSAASYGSSLGPVKKTSMQQLQSLQRECSTAGASSRSSSPTQTGQAAQEQSSLPLERHDRVSTGQSTDQVDGNAPSLHGRRTMIVGPQSVPTDKSVDEHVPATSDTLPRPSLQSTSRRQVSRASQVRARDSSAVREKSQPNPILMRSSTLPTTTHPEYAAADPSQMFNPYTIYADNKAFLELSGDLDSMAEGWTDDELRTKRRLVEFYREQAGNQVTASFKPVTLEERTPNSICVSCIWWEEKDETYVTSVDTIQLLESLVAVRFTTEEKNRIRRNLEGYKPLTVAKGKSDSEAFFKVIMDFPVPKPRNIEKDVKVFPWKIMKHALQKIMGKYVSEMLHSTCMWL